ncbi:hypothetical protein M408DRAFT_31088 [Serendipita vermifera MAFF 305830]|uniref:F-box domain-containing protein n=1 Tax=Serendipita vermifera MAFF 305830 TaxID=933852 RepID=A0A0C3AHR0_SERVB|nr:hypothetical protein M408DRAFT_31088 [Serendipita vermifera MAFF 305830]
MPWAPAGEKERQNALCVPMPFPWVDISSIIAISHVNKRWREAALATPACWSTIPIRFFSANEKEAQREKSKIDCFLSRAQNSPLNVIILDERLQDTWLPHLTELRDIMTTSIKQARGVYARMRGTRLANLVVGKLTDVPMLECLALGWHGSRTLYFESRHDNLDSEVPPKTPKNYLRYAPKLRSVQVNRFPYPDPQGGSVPLPALETFISDEDVAVRDTSPGQILQDFRPLLRSCEHVVFLTFLPTWCFPSSFYAPKVTFLRLTYIEINPTALKGLFYSPQQVFAPVLDTVVFHLKGEGNSLDCRAVRQISRELENSAAPRKRFILIRFGDDFRGLTRMGSSSWSLVGCLQILNDFKFVHSLEFRYCVWSFKSVWYQAWTNGESSYLVAAARSIDLFDPDLPDEDDPLTASDSFMEENGGLGGANISGNIQRRRANLDQGGIDSFSNSQKHVFIPNLHTLSFENCSFTDAKGAQDFADSLACRQNILKNTVNTVTGLEKICLVGEENEASMAFCSRLRQAKEMEDVDIQVTKK